MTKKHLVILQPSGRRAQVDEGKNLRLAAREMGVEIESICAENSTCGKCLVLVEEGRFEKYGLDSRREHLSPLTESEQAYFARRSKMLGQHGWEAGRARLACQARVQGDVLIHIPEQSRGNKQVVRKSASQHLIEIKPSIRQYYVELEPPSLSAPLADWDRLSRGLHKAMSLVRRGEEGLPGIDQLHADYSVLRALAQVLRSGDWKVTVTVWQDQEVVGVRPGYHEGAFGAAVDIGSTTIALYLCDLRTGEIVATESEMNPQIVYGEDVMSRIQYTVENDQGLQILHSAVVEALNRLLRKATRTANKARSSADVAEAISAAEIFEMVLVGNTTMHHLVLNLPPVELGRAPYVPAIHQALDIKARELGIQISPAGNIHVLPTIASFIGADTSGVLVAEEPHKQEQNWLIIDIGTNAELVLGNKDRLICTSTPTGPALEGAHIEHGMRAARGAIEHIQIDASTLEARYQLIGVDGGSEEPAGDGNGAKGLCGSAVIDAVAEMFRTGILDTRGRFNPLASSPRIRQGETGMEYVIAWSHETSIGRDITLSLRDVRQLQLAKAALYVAARTLLNQSGLKRPDKLILAGGFGATVNKTNAMLIGLIPDMPLEDVFAVGNAAGDGARIALLNREKRLEIRSVAGSVQRFELPTDPEFQKEFVMALNLPHMSEHFENIADLIPGHRPDPLAEKFARK
jgi:uncharacterized 2Fe-2S/4Fe-4S cluster protein (DUF4445 family)